LLENIFVVIWNHW